MTSLTIRLHRRPKSEANGGTLAAYVEQNGKLGINLLRGRSVTKVETAKRDARRELEFLMRGEVTIEFVGPAEAVEPVAPVDERLKSLVPSPRCPYIAPVDERLKSLVRPSKEPEV